MKIKTSLIRSDGRAEEGSEVHLEVWLWLSIQKYQCLFKWSEPLGMDRAGRTPCFSSSFRAQEDREMWPLPFLFYSEIIQRGSYFNGHGAEMSDSKSTEWISREGCVLWGQQLALFLILFTYFPLPQFQEMSSAPHPVLPSPVYLSHAELPAVCSHGCCRTLETSVAKWREWHQKQIGSLLYHRGLYPAEFCFHYSLCRGAAI